MSDIFSVSFGDVYFIRSFLRFHVGLIDRLFFHTGLPLCTGCCKQMQYQLCNVPLYFCFAQCDLVSLMGCLHDPANVQLNYNI